MITGSYTSYCDKCGEEFDCYSEHKCTPNKDEIIKIAIIHNREEFYGMNNVYWYQLYNGKIPPGFIKVPDTEYYEYGGTHKAALKKLKKLNYKIIEGKNI